jgi:hypothetical protein
MTLELRDLDPRTARLLFDELRRDRELHGTNWSHEAKALLLHAFRAVAHPDPTLYPQAASLLAPASGLTLLMHGHAPASPRHDAVDVLLHYYARAVCRRALQYGLAHVTLYRADTSILRRSSFTDLSTGPEALLDDLRGESATAGLPGGAGCGLSAALPSGWRACERPAELDLAPRLALAA